ncbi:sterol desaturase family protein [Ideonella oryzae]|uniref:Sterol desaturase family protein n=1 Tax=Ideonella oryzae TaxID=2937441 RepID=A0ABT1BP11_9BURK|nr:sterol desaturase family protein [Ideonella oryzae]MCO5977910.1 sterol desaturase family protein [Ideonella oryzae]
MRLIFLEHSRTAYWVDMLLYCLVIVALGGFVSLSGSAMRHSQSLAWIGLGLCAWTLLEYVLHRFVLHGMPPFRGWHALHHARPTALICTPTFVSGALFAGLVFAPAWALGGLEAACPLTLGVLMGYQLYSFTHHAIHHWRSDNAWLLRRKRQHSLHHGEQPGFYGVTSALWDHVFRTARPIRTQKPSWPAQSVSPPPS